MPKRTPTKAKAKLECPGCHAEWAEFQYDTNTGEIKPSDVKVLLGTKRTFKGGDTLACTVCGHQHTTWDLFLAIGMGVRNGKD